MVILEIAPQQDFEENRREQIQREQRIGKLVWEELSHEISEGVRTPEQAQTFYDEWFPNIPHAV